MLNIIIITSGKAYQQAAGRAAATYASLITVPHSIFVFIPESESQLTTLKTYSRRFRFSVKSFPFVRVSERKFTSQLKCQGFLFALSAFRDDELVLFVDADTYCLKSIHFSKEVQTAIADGKIGFVPDVKCRHCSRPEKPWYLRPDERVTYVNSGVILASPKSMDFFEKVAALSSEDAFLRGPFNDQKVINFALGRHFKDRLLLLDNVYNGMSKYRTAMTVIGHCAGGAGRFSGTVRSELHKSICGEILLGMRPWTIAKS